MRWLFYLGLSLIVGLSSACGSTLDQAGAATALALTESTPSEESTVRVATPVESLTQEGQVYRNPNYGFTLSLPVDLAVTHNDDSQSAGRIGSDAEFSVTTQNPLDCQDDCQYAIATQEPFQVNQHIGRRVRGYMASESPRGPVEYVSYIFEENGLFYRFTLFASSVGENNSESASGNAVFADQQGLFEDLLATLVIEPPLALLTTPVTSENSNTGPQSSTYSAIIKYAPGDEPLLLSLSMIDPATGWALAGGSPLDQHVLRTQDGGRNWRDVTPPEPASKIASSAKYAVAHFLDQSSAWVTYHPASQPVFSPAQIWFTHDGGGTWNFSQPSADPSGDRLWKPIDIHFINRQTGWLLISHELPGSQPLFSLFQTGDGGASWRRVGDYFSVTGPNPTSCCNYDMGFLDPSTGVILDKNSHGGTPSLNWTRDGGLTWANEPLPPAEPALFQNNSCRPDAVNLLPPAMIKLVITCQDAGTLQSPPFSFLYTSASAGRAWEYQPLPVSPYIEGDWQENVRKTNITFLDAITGWLLQYDDYSFADQQLDVQSTYIRSTNTGGLDWSQPTTVFWSGLFSFVNPQTGWALAQRDQNIALVQTIDGGQTWEILYPRIIP